MVVEIELWYYMTPSVLLALIGSSFIIISFSAFQEYRQKSPHHSVICCMAICDWVIALSWWVQVMVPPSGDFCFVQAFVMEFSAVAGWIWPSIFAVRLLLSNYFELEVGPRWTLISHLTGWGVALCFACGASGMYGHAGLWCWIDNLYPLAQIFMGDGLVVIMFMIELTVFSFLMYSFHHSGAVFGQLREERRNVTLRMSLFLLIPPLCWSWALADRLIEYVSGSQVYWVTVLHAVMGTSQGFFNAMVYGWDPELLYLWANVLPFCSSSKDQRHAKYKPKVEEVKTGLLSDPLLVDKEFSMPVSIDVNYLYAENEQDVKK